MIVVEPSWTISEYELGLLATRIVRQPDNLRVILVRYGQIEGIPTSVDLLPRNWIVV